MFRRGRAPRSNARPNPALRYGLAFCAVKLYFPRVAEPSAQINFFLASIHSSTVEGIKVCKMAGRSIGQA